MEKKRLAILVQTCDKYSDIWDSFYTLFIKYWPDCPYTIYHVTETLHPNVSFVTPIYTGAGVEWSQRILLALELIKEDYVLLLLEDYLLIKKVFTSEMETMLDILQKERAAYLRIYPCPEPKKQYKDYENVGEIAPEDEYSITTQATIWTKTELIGIMLGHETVWDFELKGSKRSHQLTSPMLSLRIPLGIKKLENGTYPYTYLCTAVYKGKWMREVLPLVEKEKLKIDFKFRPVESRFERMYRLYYFRSPYIIKYLFDAVKYKVLEVVT